VAKSDKDEFNFDDFQYSGVKLSPVPDLNQPEPLADPVVTPLGDAPVAADAADLTPAEPADKKGKKKKKDKPVKAKKPAKVAVATPHDGQSSPFMQKLTQLDPFTVLLGIALIALLVANAILFLELSRYGMDINTKGKVPTAMICTSDPIVESDSYFARPMV
jgi:hypothetical protein